MDLKDQVKQAYNKAEAEVDGFFARNKFTVVILAVVAAALLILLLKAVL